MTEQRTDYQLSKLDRQESLTIVKPHLEKTAQSLSQDCPAFLERLQAYLTNPDDPTHLQISHLLNRARVLQHSIGLIVSLLNQLDTDQIEKIEAQTEQQARETIEAWSIGYFQEEYQDRGTPAVSIENITYSPQEQTWTATIAVNMQPDRRTTITFWFTQYYLHVEQIEHG